jgi:subtilisin family serine protease
VIEREVGQMSGECKASETVFFRFALIALAAGTIACAPTTQELDFFWARGEKVEIIVSLDSLAVLVQDATSARSINGEATSLGLTRARDLSSEILILSLDDPVSRQGISRVGRQLKDASPGLIEATGFLVRRPGSEEPLVVTNRFIVQFKPTVSPAQIRALNDSLLVTIVDEFPFSRNLFVLAVTEGATADALTMANRYYDHPLTEYSSPDFVRSIEPRSLIPNDPLFGMLWHLHNMGPGTVDADIDGPEAWELTLGDPSVVIAILDGGFDLDHPDLKDNWWQNPDETPNNALDDDSNTYVDDTLGWNFRTLGDNNLQGEANPSGLNLSTRIWISGSHGTAVAGAAAATGNNGVGVTGSCPLCRIMLLRMFGGVVYDSSQRKAMDYARGEGADIIVNAWGYTTSTTDPIWTAIDDAADAEIVVFFAMPNNDGDFCGTDLDISGHPKAIAVSKSTNLDRRQANTGGGDCLDLLAPTSGGTPYGTLWVTTTDKIGGLGYNTQYPINLASGGVCSDITNVDYTSCFAGTSFSTPVAAGVAGLVRSVNSNLPGSAVRRLLQDTADKIEPSAADYHPLTGNSQSETHGWGRVNAFEAVRVAAPSPSGKDGVDVFVRDNELDWGNTEQPSSTRFEPDPGDPANSRGFINYWSSVDIKIDARPLETTPPTGVTFDSFVDENPIMAAQNTAYVRVRNRGPTSASSVSVKLLWAQCGTATALLPGDFWSSFPGNSSNTSTWHPMTCSTGGQDQCTISDLHYSGSSVAGTPQDISQVARFDFTAPNVQPICFLALVDSDQDHILPLSRPTQPSDFMVDQLTPRDNNVSLRNYFYVEPPYNLGDLTLMVRNPMSTDAQIGFSVGFSRDWQSNISIQNSFTIEPASIITAIQAGQPIPLAAHARIPVTVKATIPGNASVRGDLIVRQVRYGTRSTMGGVTFRFR